MVLDKRRIPVTPDIIDSNSLYYYVMKELLLKLDLKNPHITIDGIGGKKYMQKIRTETTRRGSDPAATGREV